MCVYIYGSTHVYMYVYTYICMYAYIYLWMYVYANAYMKVHVHTCTRTHSDSHLLCVRCIACFTERESARARERERESARAREREREMKCRCVFPPARQHTDRPRDRDTERHMRAHTQTQTQTQTQKQTQTQIHTYIYRCIYYEAPGGALVYQWQIGVHRKCRACVHQTSRWSCPHARQTIQPLLSNRSRAHRAVHGKKNIRGTREATHSTTAE